MSETAEAKNDDELTQEIEALKISTEKSRPTETENNENFGNNEEPPANPIPGHVERGVFDVPKAPADSISVSTIPGRSEIVEERELTLDDVLMKSSEVRWVHRDDDGQQWQPFNGRDSMLLEIRYRLDNNLPLDETDKYILKGALPDLKKECEELKAAGRKRPPTADIDEEKIVPVLNGMYKVNHDNTKVRSVFWDGDFKEIQRGMYFPANNQPIDPEEAEKIQKHLKLFLMCKNAGQSPPELRIKDNVYQWTSFHELTVKRNTNPATRLYRYHEKADWNVDYPKVEHLVFVIHGVGHNGETLDIVKLAKSLSDGADEVSMKKSGTYFLPVHWRTFIDLEYNISKEDTTPEIEFNKLSNFFGSRILEDVNLYNSYHYGKKIRNVVTRKLNDLYKKFKEIHQTFHGKISVFGHSLGSVISYDILTNYSKYKDKQKTKNGGRPNGSPIEKLKFDVHNLFLIGSPVGGFLKYREESAHEKFVKTIRNLRIFNVFHSNDLVHYRLEPFADSMYEVVLPLEIPLANGEVSINRSLQISKKLCKPVWSLAQKYYYWWKAKTQISRGLKLPYRLDHQLQENIRWHELQPHSIYWEHSGFIHFLVHTLLRRENKVILRKKLSVDTSVQLEKQVTNDGVYLVLVLKRKKIHPIHRRRRTIVSRWFQRYPDSHPHKAAIMRQGKLLKWFTVEQLREAHIL